MMVNKCAFGQSAVKVCILLSILAGISGHGTGQALPDSIKDFSPGRNAGFGQGHFPGNVLGPPNGTQNPQIPNVSESDLLSLGTGGSITLEFSTNRIIDGIGPDFTVFENPVQPIAHPEQSFSDTAIVAVSDDGEIWHTFPFDMISSSSTELPLKSNYIGFAGIQPTYSSPDNGIPPFDPSVSGGDKFDLADVGLPHVRFVKITDSGDARFAPSFDMQNDIVYDYGTLLDPDPSNPGVGISAGFDLDAVAAIHSEEWSSPAAINNWSIYE